MATKKFRIKDYTGQNLLHPETQAEIVLRGNSNVDADLTALETAVENVAVYSLVKDAQAQSGYAATYHLTKDGANEGATINIPKDFFVHDVAVRECIVADDPLPGLQPGDKYIDFTINIDVESDESGVEDQKHIYLAVADLFVPYTAGNGIIIDGTTIEIDESYIPTQAELEAALSTKQDVLTPGDGIKIENNVISLDLRYVVIDESGESAE